MRILKQTVKKETPDALNIYMRKSCVRKIQEKLNLHEVYVVFCKEKIEYLIKEKNIEYMVIFQNNCVLLGNKMESNHNEYDFIGCYRYEGPEKISRILKENKIKTVIGNVIDCSASVYNKINKIANFKECDNHWIEKDTLDDSVMEINAILMNTIFNEFFDILEIHDSYISAKNKFMSIAYSFNIDNAFFSVSKNNGTLSAYETFNDKNVYFFDCGISYQKLFSDITVAKKFVSYTTEETAILEYISRIMKEIEIKLAKGNNVNEVILSLKNNDTVYNIEESLGHYIGIYQHEEISLDIRNFERIMNNAFFTIEPLIYLDTAGTLEKFRLEKTFGNFDGFKDYFSNIVLVR
jgi:hypothetical protein